MALFLLHSLSFPTVIFSLLLTVVIVYWLIAILGLVGVNSLDIDAPNADAAESLPGGIAALLLKFRLGGIPLSLTITMLVLYGWLLSYFSHLFLISRLPDSIWYYRYLLGIGTLPLLLLASLQLTSLTLQPMRYWLKQQQKRAADTENLIGKSAIVRSASVTLERGEALLDDGGAGLIIRVRALDGNQYLRGERVVVLDYHPESHSYSVVSELEFKLLT